MVNIRKFKAYKRIRDLREDNDMSQAQMADRLHVAQRTYSRYENGDRDIPISILIEISDVFGTSIDYLLEKSDNPMINKRPYP